MQQINSFNKERQDIKKMLTEMHDEFLVLIEAINELLEL